MLHEIESRMNDEMESMFWLALTKPEQERYARPVDNFGPDIASEFPSLVYDIEEAEKCMACEQTLHYGKPSGRECLVKSADDIPAKNLGSYDFIKAESDSGAREAYNSLVSAVQSAYDAVNDFGKVAAIAKKSGLAGLVKVTLQRHHPRGAG